MCVLGGQLGDVFKDSEQITASVEAYSQGIRLAPSYEVQRYTGSNRFKLYIILYIILFIFYIILY